MYFENTGIENTVADLNLLDDIMLKYGFVRKAGWDYERVTYDKKFVVREGTFYLRIFGYASQGDIGANDALITLMKPVLGKHYFPHGVEYGEDEVFPGHLVKTSQTTLVDLKKELSSFEVHA